MEIALHDFLTYFSVFFGVSLWFKGKVKFNVNNICLTHFPPAPLLFRGEGQGCFGPTSQEGSFFVIILCYFIGVSGIFAYLFSLEVYVW